MALLYIPRLDYMYIYYSFYFNKMTSIYFTRCGSHTFNDPISGDVYIKNFEITMIDKPQTLFKLHWETQVCYKNNIPIIIPPGEYTLKLLQQLIPGIELKRGDGCEKALITLKVLDGIQIAFEPELIDLLGFGPATINWLDGS